MKKQKKRLEDRQKDFENSMMEQKFVMQEEITQLKEEAVMKTESIERFERTQK